MLCKPLIGINSDYRAAKKDQAAFTFLASRYHEAVEKAGGIPVVIPVLENEDDAEAVLERLDGFVMIGGADLDPINDGFMRHPSVRPLDAHRERFDRKLVRAIARRRLPLLAIGTGMQLLNVSQGGNLYLHIAEDMPTALPHRDSQDPNHRHALEVTPDSLMERVYGDGEIRVNSSHHMAVDEVAPGFAVTARCPDGIVEAIEHKGKEWLAVGVQFHPEAESASALDQRIFEEFICGIAGEEATQGEEVETIPMVRLVA
jgi:putative glutamine amidotransferase